MLDRLASGKVFPSVIKETIKRRVVELKRLEESEWDELGWVIRRGLACFMKIKVK